MQFDRVVPYATSFDAYRGNDVERTASHILGLDDDTADALFYASGVELEEIDPAWAARCIRKLIATGEVDWDGTYVPLSLQP